ncbi:hypothetical protein ACQEVB_00440 [Pseudonocardia sp. CA-107938]|uniref:hypothetical protein n=1 Tax=Pseudonocardia sp. CA-107938 TaxID=3240021 RepID=UPI003D8BD98E
MSAAGARHLTRRRLLALVTGIALVAGPALAGCGGREPTHGGPIDGPNGADLFSGAGSVWHQPVPDGASIDPRSADYVRQLMVSKDKDKPRVLPVVSVNGYTVPVYDADASTPRYRVEATEQFVSGGWTLPAVPIPATAAPDSRDDHHMVVVDRSAGCVYEFWGAQVKGSVWTASWVNATPVDGTGVYPDGLAARGTGISAAAGLIWPQELAAGRIDHALVFATPWTRRDAAVPPATTSDGQSGPDIAALPAGARLRLDPAVDVDALGLTPEQRTIAVALQRYGMILGDTSGSGLTLYASAPQSYFTFPYPAEWAKGTWASIDAIPFDRMQVLTLPTPSRKPTGGPVLNRCTQDAVHGQSLGTGSRDDE